MIPELPFSSLGITKGDQIIVSEDSSSAPSRAPVQAPFDAAPFLTSHEPDRTSAPQANPISNLVPGNLTGPDSVDTADGNVLVHRVRPERSRFGAGNLFM